MTTFSMTMKKFFALIAVALALLANTAATFGGQTIFSSGFEGDPPLITVQWDGGGDGTTWADNLNWVGDTLPTNGNAVVINDPGCTAKTYPRFFEDLEAATRR